MPRATQILRAGDARPGRVAGTLILTFDQRQTKQGFFFTGTGACIELDFAEPPALATDDVLVLDDGSLIDIVADAESLIEARIPDPVALARLAWRLGDRHVPVQILSNRLRLRRDAALEAMLGQLGARLTAIDAPFDPEGGAYAAQGAHEHAHGHHHDHAHHDHVHGPGCGHDHG